MRARTSLRFAFRLYRLVSWARHAVPRRFTPAGMLALTALFVTGAIGLDMDRSVAFQGFALIVCLLVVSAGSARLFRSRFTAQRTLPRHGSVGQPFHYTVRVRHSGATALRDLEWIEELADPRPTFAEFLASQQPIAWRHSFGLTKTIPVEYRRAVLKPAALPSLPPRGEAEARVELRPLRRGPLRFVGGIVARPDPFGFIRAFARMPLPQTVLILPRRYPLPFIALPGAQQYHQGGVALASSIGQSDEFISLRDYRAGDPLRHIHWRSWARLGRPIVKEFQDEFFVRHALILDTFAGPEQAEALEEAISLAASFACSVATQESLLDLMFVGPQAICFTTGRGVGHAEQALEILASAQACRERPFASLQELVLRHASAVCGCICILLAWDEPRRALIRRLRALGQPLLVLVVTDAAGQAAIRALPTEEKPEQLHFLEPGRIAEGLRALEGMTA